MKKLISTLNMDRVEWLHYRKQGLGGSDAGAVCGMNPYRTAMEVYHDKTTDDVRDTDSEAMRQGRDFEQYVAQRFTEATGKKVRRANAMFLDELNPFMLADVDRMVVGENAGLECKTSSPYLSDKWSDGNIPLHYQLQCYHYMSVMNADAWYIAVLIYGREFKFYRLERDEALIADLIQIEKNFWNEHVLKRVMPSPDGSELADRVIADYYHDSSGKTLYLSGFDEKLRRRAELTGVIARMETEKKQIEQELKLYLGDAEAAENDHYRISWKTVSTSRLDTEKLKLEQPEIYSSYLKPSSYRRFSVKAA